MVEQPFAGRVRIYRQENGVQIVIPIGFVRQEWMIMIIRKSRVRKGD
jgi:hypothetical protein